MNIPSISPLVCTVSHLFSGQGRAGEMGKRDPLGKIRQNEPCLGQEPSEDVSSKDKGLDASL